MDAVRAEFAVSRFAGLLAYGALWLVGGLVFLTPYPLKACFAQFVGSTWFHVVRFRRKIILHNLAYVFARESQEPMPSFQMRIEAIGEANCVQMVHLLLEILERFHWTRATFEHRVRVTGDADVRRLHEQNKGFFFLTAHLGNWELITLVGCLMGLRLAIVTRFLRNAFFDALWVQSREGYGLRLLEESGSGLSIVKAIRQGAAVGFILDQHTGEPHGIESEFLGRPAWCPKGLAILSDRLKCPIVPAILTREGGGRFHLAFGDELKFPRLESPNSPLRTESGSLTDEGLRYHIAVCSEKMRAWIFEHPAQYLWLHRRFKNKLDYRSPLPWEL